MNLFKLTDGQGCTMGRTQWGEGVKHRSYWGKRTPDDAIISCTGPQLCSSDVIHAYRFMELGLLMNPLHAGLSPTSLRVWEAEGEVVIENWDKVGCFELVTTKELPVPEWYANSALRRYVYNLTCERGFNFQRERSDTSLFGEYGDASARTIHRLHVYAHLPADQLQHYAERAAAEVMCERHLY